MVDWRKLAVGVGVAAGAAGAAYAGQRVLRRPHRVGHEPEVTLGTLVGDRREVAGPDGTSLLVETHGPPPERADGVVVLAHGFANRRGVWHEQVAELADHYHLVTYDQPGHGDSSPPASGAFSADLLGDALAAVVAATVPPGRRCLLVGHSLGGMTALAFARRHPALLHERAGSLLLLSTSARPSRVNGAAVVALRSLVRLREVGTRLPGRVGRRLSQAPASSRLTTDVARTVAFEPHTDPAYVQFVEQMVLTTPLDTLVALAATILRLDEERTLTRLRVPTVVAVSVDDRLTPVRHARRMAALNPAVEVVEFAGLGHMTPLTGASVVNALIARLVDEAGEAASA